MSSPGAVSELVQRWRELRASGQTPSVRELCADCPEQESEVAWRIQVLEALRYDPDRTPAVSTLIEDGPPDANEDWPRIPDYELLAVLGRGGMGVVYKALHLPLNRTVALKMILAGERATPQNLGRLRREAEAIAQLRHPNVVEIYHFDEHEGRPYFALEFVAGGDLKARLDGTPWPAQAAAGLVEQVARAVDVAHRQNIVHRDLKPANVLLTADATPKVADFGLAKYLDGEATQTRSGVLMGTPGYMAPEQAAGLNDRVTPATDVWSLGVILFELLTGRRPFAGGSWDAVTGQILHGPVPRPSGLREDLDRALEAILLKCLEKDPARRFATAGDLADELARWRRGEPTRTYPPGWWASTRRFLRRHAIACAVLAFLALAASAAVALVVRLDPDRERKAIERDLAEGRTVSLVGATGPPRWCRIRLGASATQITSRADEPFTVYAWKPCLVELVTDPQQPRFRFRGWIKHAEGTETSEAGLYVAHEARETSSGTIHSLLEFAYDDTRSDEDVFDRVKNKLPPGFRPPPPVGTQLRFRRQLFAQPDEEIAGGELLPNLTTARFRESGSGQPGWHELQLDVTPESIRAYWDGKPIGGCKRADLVLQAEKALESRKKLIPGDPFQNHWFTEFAPRKALGLCVSKGTASFRDLDLGPLPEGED
jgi:serine/threonine-protein kinase